MLVFWATLLAFGFFATSSVLFALTALDGGGCAPHEPSSLIAWIEAVMCFLLAILELVALLKNKRTN